MKEITNERQKVETTPTRTYCKQSSVIGPYITILEISRTPRHWKFTQHHRTIRLTHNTILNMAITKPTRAPHAGVKARVQLLLENFKSKRGHNYIKMNDYHLY